MAGLSGVEKTGKLEEAEREYREALRLDPTFPRAREHLKRLEEAKKQKGVK